MIRLPVLFAGWPGRLAGGAAAVAALAVVLQVHAAGQTLLASTLLLVTAAALWIYSSQRSNALRYLFPGLAAAAIFVVFPMLYTVAIGFTNYSSLNLLEPAAARAYLLDQALPLPGSARDFTLHAQDTQFRLLLAAPEAGGNAWLSPPLDLPQATFDNDSYNAGA